MIHNKYYIYFLQLLNYLVNKKDFETDSINIFLNILILAVKLDIKNPMN